MSNNVVLGVDTSNYTTSLAVMTEDGELLCSLKQLLKVKEGERGLRQSDAVFAHTVNLPRLFEEAKETLNGRKIVAVGVSEKPRDVQGSYMPCFLSGVATATAVASSLNVPLYKFSHQSGHIMASIYSAKKYNLLKREFCAFHVSGGTTEVLRVVPNGTAFSVECVGGSVDAHAGQIIDRIGVSMGLPFPSGPFVEELALLNRSKIPAKKISVRGTEANLSGLENMAIELYRKTEDKSLVCAFVLDFIGKTLSALSDAYASHYGNTPFVYSGGVMCNGIIKKMVSEGREAYFAEPAMSSDNAVGIAALALERYNTEKIDGFIFS